MFDPVTGDKMEDFATDEECVAYWLSYCKDAVGRAEAKHALKWQSRRVVQ